MKILIVSNFYPPQYIGGYELICSDVAKGLKARGHQVHVLTSTYGVRGPRSEHGVDRRLESDFNGKLRPFLSDVAHLLRKESHNQRAFRRVVKSFRPDVIYLWNLQGVSMSLALSAERLKAPVFHCVLDKWWVRCETHHPDQWYGFWARHFPNPRPAVRKALYYALRPFGIVLPAPLTISHVHFASDFLRRDASQANKRIGTSEVIYNGVDLDRFTQQSFSERPKTVLYCGQLTPMKGLRTVIEAMRLIVKVHGSDARLTVVGGSAVDGFVNEMQNLVRSYGLEQHVKFRGFVAREALPEIYREHDIFVFPSLYDEAFTVSTLEAMACGLAVVCTATGGNAEVMRHGCNALIFDREDAATCAAHVMRLLDEPELFEKLRRNGRKTVEADFSLETMIKKIERSLQEQIETVAQ